MQQATLYRYDGSDQGSFGYLVCGGLYWHSLELPNLDNQPNISCIPAGTYEVKLRYSPHFKKNLYHLQDVINRSFILIHSANFAGNEDKGWQTHLQGCIALGKNRGVFPNKFGKKQKALLSSRSAVREFTELIGSEPFTLTIKDSNV